MPNLDYQTKYTVKKVVMNCHFGEERREIFKILDKNRSDDCIGAVWLLIHRQEIIAHELS
jgi:hypothetical protein